LLNWQWAQMILRHGGKLTLSDDSHGPGDVGYRYDAARDFLAELGVTHLHYLESDRPGSVRVCSMENWAAHPFWTSLSAGVQIK
jgi:histidinol-phosphatase (PHP family)